MCHSMRGSISTSATSSSNESSKKPKDLNDQHCEFDELHSISIDIAIFKDGATSSTMPLNELAYQ
ncbi:hypothetical protein H5410_002967, partial [Solanum commersonii]